MKGEIPTLAHSFDAYSTNVVTWHSEVSEEGDMLLARYMCVYVYLSAALQCMLASVCSVLPHCICTYFMVLAGGLS